VLLNLQIVWPGWSVARILVACGLAAPLGLTLAIFSTGYWRLPGSILTIGGIASCIVGLVMLRFFDHQSFCTMTPNIDPMPVLATYLGLFGAGSMFLAIGLWISSLVRSQIVAALFALAVNLVFILGGLLILGGFYSPPADLDNPTFRVVNFVSVPLHVSQDFARGIIDTRHLVLYASLTLAMLFLTLRSLERRRWQ